MHDIVIVGAGSAGCVLAERLSADPALRVLLLEAGGPDTSPLIRMPKGFGKLLTDPAHVWQHEVPVNGAASETWLRGKTLGGSSSVNGMVWLRGSAANYDAWGLPGWSGAAMREAFAAVEAVIRPSLHGEPTPLCDAMIAGGVALGLRAASDMNDGDDERIGYAPRSIEHGQRRSAAQAFLAPARGRINLEVITSAQVQRVCFEGARAVGVEAVVQGRLQRFGATREVLLCAGGLHSPLLLQRSGIGDAALLQRFGIPVVAHAPRVGRGLSEHRCQVLQFRLAKPLRGDRGHNARLRGTGLLASLLRYALLRRGVLAGAAYDVAALLKTDPTLPRPDAQLLMAPFSVKGPGAAAGIEREPGLQCIGYLLQPRSAGRIAIAGPDAAAPPRIEPGYFSDPRDLMGAVRLARRMRELFAQPLLADVIAGETLPGAQATTDEQLAAAALQHGYCGYHAVGTCAMGADETGVTDPTLRVRGASGLRVVDASVMPTLPSGNTNGPVMALAWRAAGIVSASLRV
ncbi:MAG TPA: GMC family oxidoreductase N-terminal domain-containing protein [Burkholderiaceae bacterium]|nr:GMC family oxidoreductase N-terminal domain-containing protein [Burkholderiaceae bacterium]